MAKATAVLDLGTLNDRPKVRIDGKKYEMKSRDEVIYELHQRGKRGRIERLGALLSKSNATDREQRERSRLLNEFTRLVLVAPAAVHARLRDVHRVQIAKAFNDTAARPKA